MAESPEGEHIGPLELIKKFHAVQEERVEAYKFLERYLTTSG